MKTPQGSFELGLQWPKPDLGLASLLPSRWFAGRTALPGQLGPCSAGRGPSALGLTLVLLVWCSSSVALARPRPPQPPWPWPAPVLQHLAFDHAGVGPLTAQQAEAAGLAESFSGWALARERGPLPPLWLPGTDGVGRALLGAEEGTIVFWFNPTAWDRAPGHYARLLECVSADGAVVFSLYVAPDGVTYLSGLTPQGPVDFLKADLPWEAGRWACVALSYSPTHTRLLFNGQCVAEGPGLPWFKWERASLVIGSDAAGNAGSVAGGLFDEVTVLGRAVEEGTPTEQAVRAYWWALKDAAARGPISDEEFAAQMELVAKVRAEREAALAAAKAGEADLLSWTCVTNVPVHLTNLVCLWTTNAGLTVSFDLAGGTNGLLYDVYVTDGLTGSNVAASAWRWLARGPTCSSFYFTHQPHSNAWYVVGTPQDSDLDWLPDAYELLVTKTPTNSSSSPDTDGDGMPDGWELANGLNPMMDDAAGDRDGDGIANLQEYLNEQRLLRPQEPLGPCSRRTPLVISEIMYNPPSGQNEFIELYNSSHLPQRLDGFTLYDPLRIPPAVYYTFGSNCVLAPGGFLSVTPTNNPPNSLANRGGTIQLRNAQGAVLLHVEYDDDPPWPIEADGAGHSLVLARPSFGERDVRAWAPSRWRGGSPGYAETNAFDPLAYIKINEFLANPPDGQEDFIELYNTGPHPVDLSGCGLSDQATNLYRFSIPRGTVIAGHGFLHLVRGAANSFTFGLDAAGEQIFLTNPEGTRVLDAVRFYAQAAGITTGRYPDGAPVFSELSSPSGGTNNAAPLVRDLVINEIMFHPISENDAEEYIEVYNRGTNNQPLGGLSLGGGITFSEFPNTNLGPGQFVVVARRPTALTNKYPNLTIGVNLLGPWFGRLGNRTDQIQLFWYGVLIDEVTYADGGRWGQWADGDGSSLELIDPRSDNRLAPNWADSDESAKSSWVLVAVTNYLALGQPCDRHCKPAVTNCDALEITLGGAGECLVDNVEVWQNGTNYVTNSTFALGTVGWAMFGNHSHSGLWTNGGYDDANALHLRASGRGDAEGNKVRILLSTTNLLAGGNVAAIRARARWLAGNPELRLRLRENWLEAVATLPVPANLGTPGLPNSRWRSNAPPAICEVNHWPAVPAAGQPVLVTARLDDPDGLANAVLKYRLDPQTDLTAVAMNDRGTNGDLRAGDGVWSALLPGQAAGTLVAFHLEACDAATPSACGVFPAEAPARECLVRFGDPTPPGSFGVYRIWYTAATSNQWLVAPFTSNEPYDMTFVYGQHRIIYNAGVRDAGSLGTVTHYEVPGQTMCAYALDFPSDDPFLGAREATLDWPIRDETGQREQVANWIADQMGLPHNYRRFIHLVVNGKTAAQRRELYPAGTQVFEDTQRPNADAVEQWFADSADGHLYQFDDWNELDAASAKWHWHSRVPPRFELWRYLATNYHTGQLEKRLARYRVQFKGRALGQANNDGLREIVGLIDTLNTTNTGAAYTVAIAAAVDIEQWMRVWAFQDVVQNNDSFGNNEGKNIFAYRPLGEPWRLLIWDLDMALGETLSCAPQSPYRSNYDPVLARLEWHPPFERAYWRGIQDAVNGPLRPEVIGPLLDGHYAALVANGIAVLSPDAYGNYGCTTNYTLRQWLAQKRYLLIQALAAVAVPFAILNNNGQDFSVTNQTSLTLFGQAPVEVASIQARRIVGTNTLVLQTGLTNWTSVTNWALPVPLAHGTNRFELTGRDRLGQANAFASITITNLP